MAAGQGCNTVSTLELHSRPCLLVSALAWGRGILRKCHRIDRKLVFAFVLGRSGLHTRFDMCWSCMDCAISILGIIWIRKFRARLVKHAIVCDRPVQRSVCTIAGPPQAPLPSFDVSVCDGNVNVCRERVLRVIILRWQAMALFMEEIEDDMTGFIAPDGEESEQNAGSEEEQEEGGKGNKVKKKTKQQGKEDKVKSKWQDYLKSSEEASNPKHARLAKDRFRKAHKKVEHKAKKGKKSRWIIVIDMLA